jgi:hypothetical protein
MSSSLVSGLAGLLAVITLAVIPLACQSGGVGDPCTPDEEYGADFNGFDLAQGYIESRSFSCTTRICLVNHFQGRVSCPLGQSQSDIHPCTGPTDASCGADGSDAKCVASATLLPACTPPCMNPNDPNCLEVKCPAGLTCDTNQLICVCDSAKTPTVSFEGVNYACVYFDPACKPTTSAPCSGYLQSYVCHAEGACQTAGASVADNQGKACCVPGTGKPVGFPVCGQCDATGKRDAAQAVYCSCRCGVADGDPPEPDFNFCTCPSGFTCSELRPDFHLTGGADAELNGKYCMKDGTEFTGPASCGFVQGNHDAPCKGINAD